MYDWIDDARALADAIASLPDGQPLALDTEFIRERTYYARLALIQLAHPRAPLLLDPLAVPRPQALLDALAASGRETVMHSPGEDLQALAHHYDVLPARLFDTQVAAGLAGLGHGLSYQKLVDAVLGIALPKSETRSDWMKRPLSEAQCTYAADDVLHLTAIHADLCERLDRLGRLDWAYEDSTRMLANAQEQPDPWPHLAVRSAARLEQAAQIRLARLLRWRDQKARQSDRPKRWILDNDFALALAQRERIDAAGFDTLAERFNGAPKRARDTLLDLLSAPVTDAEAAMPLCREETPTDRARLKLLQTAVSDVAQTHALPETLLASRRMLEPLVNTPEQWPDALRGWREALLRDALQAAIGRF